MEQKEIIEGNKLILNSPFVSKKQSKQVEVSEKWGSSEALYANQDFHYNWHSLIPVVENIEKYFRWDRETNFYNKVVSFDIDYSDYPEKHTDVRISICTKLNGIGSEFHTIKSSNKNKLAAVHSAVLQFIQFYNALNK